MKDRLLYKLLDRYQDGDAKTRKRIAESIMKDMRGKKSAYWEKRTKENIRELSRFCLKNVPAYKRFVAGERKRLPADGIPVTSKASYLRHFPMKELCDPKALKDDRLVMTSTSGSTGEPFYFPRNHAVDIQSSIFHEMFFRNAKIDPKEPTLVIVGFGMGVWIGGLITYEAFKAVGERGANLSIITPGVNKKEIYDALKHIGSSYRNIILCGYPPFIKDIVDGAHKEGVFWGRLPPLRIVFAAEMFSEEFRDHVARETGMQNIYRDTMNIYGTADLGTTASETPVSILVRRLALKHEELYRKLFPYANRLPTLTQFNPDFIAFEGIDKQLFMSGYSAMPLVRYAIGDNGGVFSFDQARRLFKEAGIDLPHEIRRAGIADTATEMPFAYVYERTDLSTKLYGAIIYPEHIREALQAERLAKHLTGRFTMLTKHDARHNEYLELNIEMKGADSMPDEIREAVTNGVVSTLIERNGEYKNNHLAMKERVIPRVVFWPYEHQKYFKRTAKQKWVLKGDAS